MTVVDLFCGAGGMSLGFTEAGYEILGAIDADPNAATTYSKNIGVGVTEVDIRQVDPAKFRMHLELGSGELDILVGCPPCQGFSVMRNSEGARDQRNHLIYNYLSFVREFRPRFAVFENVPGILRTSHGKAFYDMLLQGLRAEDYGVAERELNAADFGVAQLRRRVFVAAGRNKEVPPFPWPTHADPSTELVKIGFKKPWRTVREVIERYPSLKQSESIDTVPNHTAAGMSERVFEFIRMVPKNGGSRTDVPRDLWLPCHKYHLGHTDVYGRLYWDQPSGTITSGCTNVSKGRFVHPAQDRALSAREAAALQGFPDEFVFYGNQIPRQVGNAVPPPVAFSIANALSARLSSSSEAMGKGQNYYEEG